MKLPFLRTFFAKSSASLIGSLIALVFVASSAAWVSSSSSHQLIDSGLETTPVVVGSMTGYVKGYGQLDAWRSTQLTSKCYWDAKIIKLVPEGTLVKKGDIVCELDSTEVEDYAKTRRIKLIKIKAELATAELQAKLVQFDNARRSRTAVRNFDDARYALDEYRDGNEPLTRAQLQRNTTLANDLKDQAAFRRDATEAMYRKGIATTYDMDSLDLEQYKAEQNWADLYSQSQLHDQYVAKRTTFSLEGRLAEATTNIDATKLRNELSLTQAEFAKLSDDRRFAHYTRYLGYALDSIEACTIRAPHDGRVLHANNWRKRSYRRPEIEEGAEVDFRQAVVNLPDYSRFVVEAWVDAAEINKLEIGQPASATVAALGDRELTGSVAKIGRFPTVRDRFRKDSPVYSVTLDFESEDNNLVGLAPRMDAQIEILVQDEENIRQVPIDAIVHSDDGTSVIVSDGMSLERRLVELGISNETNVEVIEGLDVGDVVIVDPPYEVQERLEQQGNALAL